MAVQKTVKTHMSCVDVDMDVDVIEDADSVREMKEGERVGTRVRMG